MQNTVIEKNLWSGGVRPMIASYGKLMMWFFLMTDALTFSAFLGAYGFQRFVHADAWPIADEVFNHFPFMHGEYPMFFVALMTFILIMSSVTMVLAVHHGHKMNKKGVIIWLGLTIIGGLIFLGSQAWEWYHFIHGTYEGALRGADGSIAHFVSGTTNEIIRHGEILTGEVAATFIASAIRSAKGTTRLTRPALSASSASIIRPVKHISIALDFPTNLVRRCVPPAPGIVPIVISG